MNFENSLQISEAKIEDIRDHSPEIVITLQKALASGGTRVRPDSKRPNFFEIQADPLVYYVHISPATGKILLLGTWPAEAALEMANPLG